MFAIPIRRIKLVGIAGVIALLAAFSCRENAQEEIKKVDFSHRQELSSFPSGDGRPLQAAVAAMTSPEENFFYYNQIFSYISRKIGRRVLFKQRKTYHETNELLRTGKLDFAFICSGAYVEAKEDFGIEILVIPEIDRKTEYHAYIIARKDSSISRLEDLRGKAFALTDPLSNTGCLYPRYLLRNMNQSEEDFFSRVIYTYAHDYSILAVKNRIVDAASVDSLIFDYILKRNGPQKMDLKIIQRSPPFGMPPVVVHAKIDPRLKKELHDAFLNMSSDPEGRKILSHLHIDRFVLGKDRDYDSIREMRDFLLSQGYEN